MARDRYDDEDDERGPPRGRGRSRDDDDDDDDDDYEAPRRGTPPPNYLVQSILVTLCCCLPFGIVAIVYAAQVNSKWQSGDSAGARRASDAAKMWSWIGFGIGIVANLIGVAIQVMAAQAGGVR
ncbi:CD225/dispanin family protein [Gemmata sp. JC717]|uniref:CD225/dispanin family protein n=1 Tax=Gemmata algarum TaxID=2975278 RepID=A0ABU5ETT6_9BACT|nr:CD225/dispanin family protein [Gemmata algarum]MDY3554434.1 CD225/dispanin family protein [Gemmata algarum]MDY3558575.1 CD225/dispanin family protein [Gemmata algarum]